MPAGDWADAAVVSKHPEAPTVVLAVKTERASVMLPRSSDGESLAELRYSQATLTRYAGTPS